jgi:hypothetical protein
LVLEKTLQSQTVNTNNDEAPEAPDGNNIMTYVVVDMAEADDSQKNNLASDAAEDRNDAQRNIFPTSNFYVVNSNMVASHHAKQQMPFNHFRHPSTGGAGSIQNQKDMSSRRTSKV